VVVKAGDKVSPTDLQTAGVAGHVFINPTTLHLIVGLNADQYAAEMRTQMA
jgi:PTS system glucose-specific IIC component